MTISATRIDLLLGNRGLTRKALAERSGISPQSVSTIIRRGTCNPITAGKIARALGVDVTDIIAKGE